jgi:hypothetical protein
VPSEHVVYDEGHGIGRPSALADYFMRSIAWFDYWLRDVAYPDSTRQRDYDKWKRARADEPSLVVK